ncbi:hypothetical protein [Halomonas sp. 707B3]|uniref:hypothetical protein n=1 Tax=Halomonas sp. 707B3 TaxID=1681043 RepID=UPI00209F319F|nr:hypothetical protein [Halomonas sp. 707B3]MCP1316379.1 hypothetical protein [Halomonas sp. 707B3]
MKPINALLAAALLALCAVSGCTTTEYIHVIPECTPPPQPALPEIDRGELWDALGDDRYRELERYINGVWAFSDEQGALLDSLCE